MSAVHAKRLESKLKRLRRNLDVLAKARSWETLIPIWRQPGWTTPAEFLLVVGVLDTLVAQTEVLAGLKTVLDKGSRGVRPG